MAPSKKKLGVSKKRETSKREEKRNINIRSNSSLFFQLGLIISLLIAFWIAESEWELVPTAQGPDTSRRFMEEVTSQTYVLENISEPKIKRKTLEISARSFQKITLVSVLTQINNTLSFAESNLPDTEISQENLRPNHQGSTSERVGVRTENLNSIQEVPIFPGCESLESNEERKFCFQKKIQEFMAKKFDIDQFIDKYADEHQRIDVKFTVTATGMISDLEVNANFEDLSQEAEKVILKLPTMTPGKQNGKPVAVVYRLPISLNIKY